PGEYYVSALSRTFNFIGRGLGRGGALGAGGPAPGTDGGPGLGALGAGGRGDPGGAAGPGRGGRGGPSPDALGALAANAPQVLAQLNAAFGNGFGPDTDPVTYAPTFYPGVASVEDARSVTVGLSAEVLDVNFGLLFFRTGGISGHVTKADGMPSTRGNLTLMSDSAFGGRGGFGRMLGARVQWDG